MGTGAEVAAPEALGAAKGAGEAAAGFSGADAAAGSLLASETAGAGITAAEAAGLTGLGEAGTTAAGTAAANAADPLQTLMQPGASGPIQGGLEAASAADPLKTAMLPGATGPASLANAGAAATQLASLTGPTVTDVPVQDVPFNGLEPAGMTPAATTPPVGAPGMESGLPGAASGAGASYEEDLLAKIRAAQAASVPTEVSMGQKALNAITGNPLTAGALGLNALGQINAAKSGKTVAAQLQKQAQPVQAISDSLLSQYQAGTISPSTSFDIQKWKNQQIAQTNNYYAKAGIPDSSAAKSALANIEAKAVAMEDQARQGLLTQGLAAAGVAAGPASAAITAQAQQDQNLQQASGSALNSLMLLQAMQSGGMAPGNK